MNKVKLGELLQIKHGFAFKSERYVDRSKYALVTLANISATNNFQFNIHKTTFYGADFPKDFILQEDDLIMPLTEQVIGLFGNTAFVPHVNEFNFVLNQRVGKIIPIEGKADKYYLHYLLATEGVKNQLEYRASGTRQRNISPTDVYDVEVFLPDIEEQRKIGKCLYDIEKKINTNNKINDNLQKQLCLIYENMMRNAQYGNVEGTFIIASKLTDVLTGKEDANFASSKGKYKFFTCSNDTLNCDEYVFDNSAIMIAGNGDFNVKHYSGKFNAYQRTYVLIPNHKYYGLLYLASLYQINSFKSASSGSIVKFVTKGDIENISVFVPKDERILNELNRLLVLQENNQSENEELNSLRDWLLPMLMNGQATIED